MSNIVNHSSNELTEKDLSTLVEAGIIPRGTPVAQVKVFAKFCAEKGLSPYSKQVYLIKTVDKNNEEKYFPFTSIDGLLATANRTGLFAGVSDAKFNLKADGMYQTAHDLGGKMPETCTITVKKVVGSVLAEFTKTVIFKEFSSGKNKWNAQYGMPVNMIIKVNTAHTLRLAFSELAGLYAFEEEGSFAVGQTVDAETIDLTESLKAAIKDATTKEELKQSANSWQDLHNCKISYSEALTEVFKQKAAEVK